MVSEKVELHAIVHGKVQGVGFRATTRHYAQQLKLEGFVRNCPEGTVEIIVQGVRKHLDALLAQLKVSHKISSIDIEYTPACKKYHGFSISH